ncbi:hypothetical protein NL108_012664, partial [Boleophthalmus pectinirostris]
EAEVSFCLILADKDRSQRWTADIKREGWEPTVYNRLCGQHFISGEGP